MCPDPPSEWPRRHIFLVCVFTFCEPLPLKPLIQLLLKPLIQRALPASAQPTPTQGCGCSRPHGPRYSPQAECGWPSPPSSSPESFFPNPHHRFNMRFGLDVSLFVALAVAFCGIAHMYRNDSLGAVATHFGGHLRPLCILSTIHSKRGLCHLGLNPCWGHRRPAAGISGAANHFQRSQAPSSVVLRHSNSRPVSLTFRCVGRPNVQMARSRKVDQRDSPMLLFSALESRIKSEQSRCANSPHASVSLTSHHWAAHPPVPPLLPTRPRATDHTVLCVLAFCPASLFALLNSLQRLSASTPLSPGLLPCLDRL